MECLATGIDHWFITNMLFGMWHGFIAILSLVLSLFWEVTVYDVCLRDAWFYNLGFIIGVWLGGVVGLNMPEAFVIILILAGLVKLVFGLALPIATIAAVVAGVVVVGFLFRFLYRQYVSS